MLGPTWPLNAEEPRCSYIKKRRANGGRIFQCFLGEVQGDWAELWDLVPQPLGHGMVGWEHAGGAVEERLKWQLPVVDTHLDGSEYLTVKD